jgi:hypothetical protein
MQKIGNIFRITIITFSIAFFASCSSEDKPEDKQTTDSTASAGDSASVSFDSASAALPEISEDVIKKIAGSEEAGTVLMNCINARGGIEAVKKIKSLKISADATDGKATEKLNFYYSEPQNYRLEYNSGDMKILLGRDSTSNWGYNTEKKKYDTISDIELLQSVYFFRQKIAEFIIPLSSFIDPSVKIDFKGEVDDKGKKAYKLVFKASMKDKEGNTHEAVLDVFIDKETNLDYKYIQYVENEKKEKVPVTINFLNDRKVGSFLVPFVIEYYLGNEMVQKKTLKSIDINKKLDAALFKMPANQPE